MSSRFFHGSDTSSDSSEDEEELYSGSDEEEAKKSKKKAATKDASSSGESDSDDSDDSDEEDSDSDDSSTSGTGVNRFLVSEDGQSAADEEEDKPTVVKSARDKRFEELEGTVRLIENALKIGDWAVISGGRILFYDFKRLKDQFY